MNSLNSRVADMGQIHTFNEGAVDFTINDLANVLAEGNPELRPDRIGARDILDLKERGIALRWMAGKQPMPGIRLPVGDFPPYTFNEAVTHVSIHEGELAELPDYGIGVPHHSTFVVEHSPYARAAFGAAAVPPVVFTAVARLNDPPLVDGRWLHEQPDFMSDGERLAIAARVAHSFIDFYGRPGAGSKGQVLGADAAQPCQVTPDATLIDLDPYLSTGPRQAISFINEWTDTLPQSYRSELRAYADETLANMSARANFTHA